MPFTKRSTKLKIIIYKQDSRTLIPQGNVALDIEHDDTNVFHFALETPAIGTQKYPKLQMIFKGHDISLITGSKQLGNIYVNISHNGEELLHLDLDGSKGPTISFKGYYIPEDFGIEVEFTDSGAQTIRILAKQCPDIYDKSKVETICYEMVNYSLKSNLENNAIQFGLIVEDDLKVNQSFPIYNDLFKFSKQKSEFEFFLDKNKKQVQAQGHIDQDETPKVDFLLNTKVTPHKFNFWAPNVLDSIQKIGVTFVHKKGQYLEVITDYPFFKGFKIIRTGNGNEREIFWNGERLDTADFNGNVDIYNILDRVVKMSMKTIEEAHILEKTKRFKLSNNWPIIVLDMIREPFLAFCHLALKGEVEVEKLWFYPVVIAYSYLDLD